MGRSYWFECPKCGYRAKVSGRADQGLTFFVQTILCCDCRELYDAVTRLKVPDEWGGWGTLAEVAEDEVCEDSSSQRDAARFSSGPEPVAANGSEALQVASFQDPVPGLGDSPGAELERSGPMPEVRRLPGEERAAVSALGLRASASGEAPVSALGVIHDRGRDVEQHGNGAEDFEPRADSLAVHQRVLELNVHAAAANAPG